MTAALPLQAVWCPEPGCCCRVGFFRTEAERREVIAEHRALEHDGETPRPNMPPGEA